MPAPETSNFFDKLLLWPATGYESYGEVARAGSCRQIDCTWKDGKGEMKRADGVIISYDAKVAVPESIPMGSTVFKGSATDLAALQPGTGTAAPAADLVTLYEVAYIRESSDLKGRAMRRELILKRLSATMPSTL